MALKRRDFLKRAGIASLGAAAAVGPVLSGRTPV